MKILVAECKQETSSFNPRLSPYEDFETASGEAILKLHDGVNTEMAGALEVFREHQLEVIPGYSARAICSGGPISAQAFRRIAKEFLEAVREAPPVDGVYLSMHGAMEAADEDDPEGYLLQETRRLLGEEVPIVVSLDLHGVITDRMLSRADAVVPYHTYPHVDFASTGARAARLLLKILKENARPVTVRVVIPALVRGDELITETGLFGRLIQRAKALEESGHALAAGMFIGNPFTDVPELCSNSLVVTNGDPDLAAQEATRLAEKFWSYRQHLQAQLTPLEEAIARARRSQGTVIFMDPADATSSGASGDSNVIIRALFESRFQGSVLAPLVDPRAVEDAFRGGVGATVRTSLGGAIDPLRFDPLEVEATVRMLSDGCFPSESNGTTWHAGRCAVLEFGNVTVVASSRPVSLYDRSLFLAHGQDPRAFKVVVVKSPHCQPQFYEQWADQVIVVDTPGATSANLPTLGHEKCCRPIFPLDADVDFSPAPKRFERPQRSHTNADS
jgi:microcystin degradation protein MlrC